MKQIKIATLNIVVIDRHKNIEQVNKLLTDYGYLIIARLGVSVERHCLKGCRGIICLVAEGSQKELGLLTQKLDKLAGTQAKIVYLV